MLEVRATGLAFRHELARRAVEAALPALRRRLLNRAVVTALRARPHRDPDRLVHHALEADDGDTVAAFAPAAGREAAAAGRAPAGVGALRDRAAATSPCSTRPSTPACSTTTRGSCTTRAASTRRCPPPATPCGARDARRPTGPVGGAALVRLTRHLYMAGDTDGAQREVDRAVAVLDAAGAPPAARATRWLRAARCSPSPNIPTPRSRCSTGPGSWPLGRADRPRRDVPELPRRRALRPRRRAGLDTCGPAWRWPATPTTTSATARGYTNLAEPLYRFGRFDELAALLEAGLEFTRERGFWSHAYNLDVHRCLLLMRRGRVGRGAGGPARPRRRGATPACSTCTACPAYARLLARRGDARPDRCWTRPGGGRRRNARCSGSPSPASPWPSGLAHRASRAGRRGGGRAAPAARPAAPRRPRRGAALPGPGRVAVDAGPSPSRGRPGCAATGGPPPPAGRGSATPTSRRLELACPARSSRPCAACACSRTWARRRLRRWSAPGWPTLGVDPRAPAGRARRPGPTPPGLTARQLEVLDAARRRADQRRDRRPPRGLRADRRPPRRRRTGQARGPDAPRGASMGSRYGLRGPRPPVERPHDRFGHRRPARSRPASEVLRRALRHLAVHRVRRGVDVAAPGVALGDARLVPDRARAGGGPRERGRRGGAARRRGAERGPTAARLDQRRELRGDDRTHRADRGGHLEPAGRGAAGRDRDGARSALAAALRRRARAGRFRRVRARLRPRTRPAPPRLRRWPPAGLRGARGASGSGALCSWPWCPGSSRPCSACACCAPGPRRRRPRALCGCGCDRSTAARSAV